MTAGRRDFPLWSTLLLQFRPHFSFGRSEDKSRSIPNERPWKAKYDMKTLITKPDPIRVANAVLPELIHHNRSPWHAGFLVISRIGLALCACCLTAPVFAQENGSRGDCRVS